MLKWGSFVKGKNGEWDGLNNAAIYSFNSNIVNSFVREMFQNSIDARVKKLDKRTGKRLPLQIRIQYKSISQNQFPDFGGFYEIFKMISTSGPNKNKSNIKFFNNAFGALGSKKRIPLFIYEDFNTIGLFGDDDDPQNRFNACVVSEGISVKSDSSSLGSFGIGKNAIFGLSQLRTVFYSSMDHENEQYIFQGKAKLASYYDNDGKTRDNKIYCGIGSEYKSLRKFTEMPESYKSVFHRSVPGLSQYAICPVMHKDWPEEFVKAILRNYWMLLSKGELEVKLFEEEGIKYEIKQSNLEELLKTFFNPDTFKRDGVVPEGNPFEYYKCYKEGESITKELPLIGGVTFYFRELKNFETNKIAYLRSNMVVYTDSIWGFGSIGYCGIFICNNNKGNEVLKAMEPPQHNSFHPDLLQEKHKEYNADDGRLILNKINALIKDGLQSILDKYTKKAEDIPWLDQLLSSITGAAGNGSGDRTNVQSQKETIQKIGRNISKELKFKSQERNSIKITTKDVGPDPGPGPGPGPGPRPNPNRRKKVNINSRIFITNKTTVVNGKIFHHYNVHLKGDKVIEKTDVVLLQKGDSGNVVAFELGKVFDGENEIHYGKRTNKAGEITAYELKSISIPSVLDIAVNEPYKSSFIISK